MIKRQLSSVAMGLWEVIVGISLLADPVGATSGILIAFGIVLMIMGIHKTVRYFRTDPEEAAVGQILVKGLLTLLAGAFCTFASRWIIASFPVLTLGYGAVILTAGITKVQWTIDIIRMKRCKWIWEALSAALSVVCGIVIVAVPFGTTEVLWIFIGISLIAEAALDVIGGFLGNREKPADASGLRAE